MGTATSSQADWICNACDGHHVKFVKIAVVAGSDGVYVHSSASGYYDLGDTSTCLANVQSSAVADTWDDTASSMLISTADAENGYGAVNATSFYNITNTTTTSTSIEYETGTYGKLLRHFFDEECLAKDPQKHKRTTKVCARVLRLCMDGGGAVY